MENRVSYRLLEQRRSKIMCIRASEIMLIEVWGQRGMEIASSIESVTTACHRNSLAMSLNAGTVHSLS